jgi:hypothetical protein
MHLRPRFSLRTLLVLVAIIGVCAMWVSYQLDWIRQRQAFLNENGVFSEAPGVSNERAVWPLPWFAEKRPKMLMVPFVKVERAQELFPEVPIMLMPER